MPNHMRGTSPHLFTSQFSCGAVNYVRSGRTVRTCASWSMRASRRRSRPTNGRHAQREPAWVGMPTRDWDLGAVRSSGWVYG
eukprot:3698109-Prymnesium_polylepis.1